MVRPYSVITQVVAYDRTVQCDHSGRGLLIRPYSVITQVVAYDQAIQ